MKEWELLETMKQNSWKSDVIAIKITNAESTDLWSRSGSDICGEKDYLWMWCSYGFLCRFDVQCVC